MLSIISMIIFPGKLRRERRLCVRIVTHKCHTDPHGNILKHDFRASVMSEENDEESQVKECLDFQDTDKVEDFQDTDKGTLLCSGIRDLHAFSLPLMKRKSELNDYNWVTLNT